MELVEGELAHPCRTADDARRAEHRAHGGQVLGGVGLADRPSERPAVADDRIGDDLLRVPEDRENLGEFVGFEQPAVAHEGTDANDLGFDRDVVEFVPEVVDVDQEFRIREPQLHHREKTVSAGDDAGIFSVPVEQLDGVLHSGCARVFERARNLHEQLPPSGGRIGFPPPIRPHFPLRRPG